MASIPRLSNYPYFLLRSTLGISLIAGLLVIPLGLFHLLSGSHFIASAAFFLGSICLYNALRCHQGDYVLKLNLYLITPTLVLCSIIAIISLDTVGAYWTFLALIGSIFSLPEKPARLVTIVYLILMSSIGLSFLALEAATRFIMVMVGISLFATLAQREVYKQHFLLEKASITDPLTGLNNRSLLESTLDKTINHFDCNNNIVSLAIIDIDHFKKVNDRHGHDRGDIVLQKLSTMLQKHFRESDLIFRIGGEEFLVILHDSDALSSFDAAERFRQEVEKSTLIEEQNITVSIGLSTLKPNMLASEWMKKSDDNLYLAKSGRNRVIHQ